MGAEIILEHGLAELYALFNAFFMRHVDAVMCATDAAADALLLCACVRVRLSVYCVLAHCAGKPKRQP